MNFKNMKQILLFLSLVFAQSALVAQVKTAGVNYSVGAPAWTPSVNTASELAIDTVSKRLYLWNRNTGAWDIQGRGVDQTSGSTPPAYTPNQTDSYLALNNANPPELYAWTGSAWAKVGGTVQTIDTFSVSGSIVSLSLSGDGQPARTVTLPGTTISGLTDNYITRANGTNNIENSSLFDNGTQVGFNTNSPEATFHVKKSDVSGSAAAGSFAFLLEDGVTNAVLGLQTDMSRNAEITFGDQWNLSDAGIRYNLSTSATHRKKMQFFVDGRALGAMTIDSTRKIGINNDTPQAQLHVNQTDVSGDFPAGWAVGVEHNSDDVVVGLKTNSIRSNRLWFGDNTNNALGGILYYGSTHGSLPNHMQLWSAGAARVWLDEAGRLGIGVDPAARLHVQGSGSTSATNNLLVTNSAAAPVIKGQDDRKVTIGYNLDFTESSTAVGNGATVINSNAQALTIGAGSSNFNFSAGSVANIVSNGNTVLRAFPSATNCVSIGAATNPSYTLDVLGSSGNLGVRGNALFGADGTAATSRVDIIGANGYSQVRLRTAYTPTSTADTNGNTGDISWDANYFYVKTAAGWKRSALTTW
jgi:hypothetical protein